MCGRRPASRGCDGLNGDVSNVIEWILSKRRARAWLLRMLPNKPWNARISLAHEWVGRNPFVFRRSDSIQGRSEGSKTGRRGVVRQLVRVKCRPQVNESVPGWIVRHFCFMVHHRIPQESDRALLGRHRGVSPPSICSLRFGGEQTQRFEYRASGEGLCGAGRSAFPEAGFQGG